MRAPVELTPKKFNDFMEESHARYIKIKSPHTNFTEHVINDLAVQFPHGLKITLVAAAVKTEEPKPKKKPKYDDLASSCGARTLGIAGRLLYWSPFYGFPLWAHTSTTG